MELVSLSSSFSFFSSSLLFEFFILFAINLYSSNKSFILKLISLIIEKSLFVFILSCSKQVYLVIIFLACLIIKSNMSIIVYGKVWPISSAASVSGVRLTIEKSSLEMISIHFLIKKLLQLVGPISKTGSLFDIANASRTKSF